MKLSAARNALRLALRNGTVAVQGHAKSEARDEGADTAEVLAELATASATGSVARNAGHAGRWIAFGVRLGMSFEVLDDGRVEVVTVFGAELG